MLRAAVPVFVAALSFTASASARPTPDLAVVGKPRAPARALSAHTISLAVVVRNRGRPASRPARLVVRLGPLGSTPSPRPVGSARIPRLAGRRQVRLRVRAVVPEDAERTRSRLTACVPPGTQANDCSSSRPVAIAGGSSLDLVWSALRAHRLDLGTAYLDVLRALRRDPTLPRRYRGKGKVPTGALIAQMVADLPRLPAAERARLLPYFLPPTLRRSAWAPRRGRRRAAARIADTPCGVGTPAKLQGVWTAVETPHVSVWYVLHSASGRANAQRIAAAIRSRIWPTLTGAFKAPPSDAGAPCQGGLNGKLDVFLAPSGGDVGQGPEVAAGTALTWQLLTTAPFAGCQTDPTWILLRENAPRSTVAHEFMHAVQHAYASCSGSRTPEWVEGTANWAEWFVYPQDQSRTVPDNPIQLWDPHFATVVPPGAAPGTADYGRGYAWWSFWMSLSRAARGGRTTSPVPIRRLFEASEQPGGTLESLIRAAAGTSVRDAWKRYDVERWNRAPVGRPGSPIRTGFAQWYGIVGGPHNVSPEALSLPKTTYDWFGASAPQPPATTRYRWLTFADRRAREITVRPGAPAAAAGTGLVIQAFIRLGDGKWRIEDWTGRDHITLCRDRADQDVQELVLAFANATTAGPDVPGENESVGLRNTCGFPKRFDGSWTRVYTWPGQGSWTETIHGTASFVRSPVFPPETDALSSVPYDLDHGTITWSVSGSTGGPCPMVFSGSGSEPATSDTSFGTPTSLTLEKVTGHPGAPDPEPKPFYYSIRDGQDPLKSPPYHVSDCHGALGDEQVVLPYLEVGYPNPINVGAPLDQVQKSAEAGLLEGHQVRPDPTNVFTIDDTWSFTGSNP